MRSLHRLRRKRLIVWVNGQGYAKIAATMALVALMAYLLFSRLPSTETWSHWTLPLSGRIIAIDAGHGGPDGGAVSSGGLVEKQVTLAIAGYLRDYLQEAGASVVMTRESDKDLAQPGTQGLSKRKTEDLHARAELIARSGADMLVSIHLNSIASSKWRGAQTFYYAEREEGRRLAELIQDEFRTALGNTDRLTQPHDTYFLLKTLNIPGALVEAGFLSNAEEARNLGDSAYQKKVAATIYRGILRYAAGEKIGS
ncbi:N-acetylmuramoyl-L-alanine amidase CwlD [Paenibacillus thermoaerophilus]|jgi:N-acetylmuramoyl-L-alanine amidase|uniref:N-acetylmuramoyl-L-alanine amidase CwlD n=1 Tax=Paenibacillus thermoaerophilus TaxID=1215385 RepID=A0ABW2V1L4_9BACL|nr:N-acetylmuramoyl-L-alanine amidase CwlD [Paenibacillus thermoaerophilus]TMV10934.1 N-acetylmuramoyl-L-alanine amidase CwlD [Paenibacillus thermoaerophilus]